MAKINERFKTLDEAQKRLQEELNNKDQSVTKVDLRVNKLGTKPVKLIVVSYPVKPTEDK